MPAFRAWCQRMQLLLGGRGKSWANAGAVSESRRDNVIDPPGFPIPLQNLRSADRTSQTKTCLMHMLTQKDHALQQKDDKISELMAAVTELEQCVYRVFKTAYKQHQISQKSPDNRI